MRGLVIAALLFAASPSRGDDTTLLRQQLRDANAQFNMGNFPAALSQFQDLYRASSKHALLFNIAQCYRQMGDLQKAAANYRSFIRLDPENPTVPTAKELLATVEEQLAREVKVKTAPPTGVPPEATTTAVRQEALERPSRALRPVALALGGAAVLCAGAGALFGMQARSAASDWRKDITEPAWSNDRSRAQSALTRTNIAFTAAGVLAAASVAAFILQF